MVIATLFLVGSAVPEAEYPWPDRIGPEFPFMLAGGLGIFAGAWPRRATPEARDRAARIGSFFGLWFGTCVYLTLLAVQVAS